MRSDARLTALLTAVGAVAVGAAVQVADGYGRPVAFVWLTVAVAAVLLAVVLPTHRTIEAVLTRALPPVLVVGLAWQLWTMLQRSPARPFDAVPGWRPWFLAAAVVAVGAACAIAAGRGVVRHAGILALLATHLALGVWTIRAQPAPSPMIDVFMFQRDAVAALLSGVNPYAITFPNPYPTGAYYGPDMVVDGRLMFGFVYPPLSAFLSVLGGWAGDVRYAQLGAMTLAAACMAYTRRGRLGGLAAGLYLFTPRNLFVLEQSWTEPFVVLFLAATVWCAARHPRVAPVALGLFLAVKQYAVLALPLALLIGRPPMTFAGFRRIAVPAVVVVAVVTLPLRAVGAGRVPAGRRRAAVLPAVPARGAELPGAAGRAGRAAAVRDRRGVRGGGGGHGTRPVAGGPDPRGVRARGGGAVPGVLRAEQAGVRQLLLLRGRRAVRGGGGDGPVGGGPAGTRGPGRRGCTASGPRRTRRWRDDGGQRRTISTVKPAISSRR